MTTGHYLIPRVYCGARTRVGGCCRQPAMPNGRCRMHGGKSKSGKEHGRYIHGNRSNETKKFKRLIAELTRATKELQQVIP